MTEKRHKSPYICQCAKCVGFSTAATAQLHQQINQLATMLNEKGRRQFVGLLARQLERGKVTLMTEVTGLNRNTIRRGQREIATSDCTDRVRIKGGGRPLIENPPWTADHPGNPDGRGNGW
jgi:hypothetical protein